jgi:superfamily II DNA or RNA helicase
LHPNGRALIARLQAGGPWTLVLDECHHLLELWGRLLQAVIEQIGKPRIVGLTATPPHLMTAEQAVLHRALFGAVDLEVSAPALVREGLLAPYQELAFLTRPSPAEADYIHGESLRFAELRAGLLDPSFASVPFLGWLQARVVERRGAGGTLDDGGARLSWARFEKDEPALADAAVRLHVAGLLDLPEGGQGPGAAPAPAGRRGLGGAHRRLHPSGACWPARTRGTSTRSGPSAGRCPRWDTG